MGEFLEDAAHDNLEVGLAAQALTIVAQMRRVPSLRPPLRQKVENLYFPPDMPTATKKPLRLSQENIYIPSK